MIDLGRRFLLCKIIIEDHLSTFLFVFLINDQKCYMGNSGGYGDSKSHYSDTRNKISGKIGFLKGKLSKAF